MLDDKEHILASDSLADRMPDFNEVVAKEEEATFFCTLVFDIDEMKLLTGRVIGVSLDGPNNIKIDFRVCVDEAFEALESAVGGGASCHAVYLRFGERILQMDGPFEILSPRTTDFDTKSKNCTLGIDLVKRQS